MIEVEAKARAKDDTEERIAALGGLPIAVEAHRDLYFNSPLRDFKKSDEALRIRIKEEGARLTYKGPKLDGLTKSRREITVKIDSPKRMEEILSALGFALSATVCKRRSKYSFEGAVLALDEVEGLGRFLEVELLVEGRGTQEGSDGGDESDCCGYEEQKEKVLSILARLGLDESIRSSYLELLDERRR